MADKPKRTILVKGNCENCAKPVGVEVIEPDPIVQVVKEPCKCGMDSDSRVAKVWSTALAFVICSFAFSLMGSCISKHYFTTQQMRAMKEGFKIEEAGKEFDQDPVFQGNDSHFRVVPKPEAKPEPPKKEEKK